MDQKHIGSNSEFIAIVWLQQQGYEVHRNVCQHGPHDLVIFDMESKEYTGIDVKTCQNLDMNKLKYEHPDYVKILYVHPPSGKCWWPDPRPTDHKKIKQMEERKAKTASQAKWRSKFKLDKSTPRPPPDPTKRYNDKGQRITSNGTVLPDWMTGEYWVNKNTRQT